MNNIIQFSSISASSFKIHPASSENSHPSNGRVQMTNTKYDATEIRAFNIQLDHFLEYK